MIRRIARGAALVATAIDLAGAWAVHRHANSGITVSRAALASGIALVPCALAFASTIAGQWRRRAALVRGSLRLPITVPRGYLGAAVLGGIAALSAMGERYGLFVFMAGIVLIALALSQALPRRR